MKRILNILFWIVVVAGVIFAVGFVNKKHKSQSIKTININIQSNDSDNFITENDIYTIIEQIYDSIEGLSFADLDIETVERSINHNQYIYASEVHATIDGIIEIDVMLREPVVRVINTGGEQCYIDTEGQIMELHKSQVSHVMIASGSINDPLSCRSIRDYNNNSDSLRNNDLQIIFKLATYIRNHTFYNAMIEQIYFNPNGDIELIPKLGNHLIILGDTNDLEMRMGKLMAFYQKGLRNMDWYKYKTINLKYNNQVVCSK